MAIENNDSFLESISNSDANTIVSDISEIGLDSFLKDGVFKDIPALNWLQAGIISSPPLMVTF